MAGEVVAYLEVMLDGRDADGKFPFPHSLLDYGSHNLCDVGTQNDIEIRGSEQFYLGRNGAVW
jgi:hypothetical protein